MPRECFGAKALDGIQSEQASRHVSRRSHKALRVRRPLDAEHIVVVPRIRPVKHEWREFSHKVIRRPPYLDVRAVRHCNVPACHPVSLRTGGDEHSLPVW